jgi:type II secretory pathway component PulJ
MRSLGIFAILLGGSSFVFPCFNRQSLIMSVFGEHEKTAAIAVAAVGAVLTLLSFRKKKKAQA